MEFLDFLQEKYGSLLDTESGKSRFMVNNSLPLDVGVAAEVPEDLFPNDLFTIPEGSLEVTGKMSPEETRNLAAMQARNALSQEHVEGFLSGSIVWMLILMVAIYWIYEKEL